MREDLLAMIGMRASQAFDGSGIHQLVHQSSGRFTYSIDECVRFHASHVRKKLPKAHAEPPPICSIAVRRVA